MKKFLYFILGLITSLVIIYLVVLNLPQSNTKNKEAAYSFQSVELFSKFTDDESKATKEYVGQVIELEGRLLETSKDKSGATVLILDGGDMMGAVVCTFESKVDPMPEIGTTVKLKGQCNGILTDVLLSKCNLVRK